MCIVGRPGKREGVGERVGVDPPKRWRCRKEGTSRFSRSRREIRKRARARVMRRREGISFVRMHRSRRKFDRRDGVEQCRDTKLGGGRIRIVFRFRYRYRRVSYRCSGRKEGMGRSIVGRSERFRRMNSKDNWGLQVSLKRQERPKRSRKGIRERDSVRRRNDEVEVVKDVTVVEVVIDRSGVFGGDE